DFAKRQAIGDSLFANLVTEVLGEGGIKKLFGENDPFSPKHMMEKADYLLEDYNRTLGVGLSLFIDKADKSIFENLENGKLTNENVKLAIKKLEEKGITIDDIYAEGEKHLIQQKSEIENLQKTYDEMLKAFPNKKFDKGDRWVDNITQKFKEKSNKAKLGAFDHEEGGLTCPLVGVALHISSLGGYDFEKGELNDVGKAIIESNRKTGYLDGQPQGGQVLTEVEAKNFKTAMATANKYIEVMRLTKTGEFLFTARSSLIEREKFSKVASEIVQGDRYVAIKDVKQVS
ncbi:MAG: hypothetical protein SFT90_05840, partial [Rickettsiales bacterium]|nr:hypothetical protein [Rickettsiales bacterium]